MVSLDPKEGGADQVLENVLESFRTDRYSLLLIDIFFNDVSSTILMRTRTC